MTANWIAAIRLSVPEVAGILGWGRQDWDLLWDTEFFN